MLRISFDFDESGVLLISKEYISHYKKSLKIALPVAMSQIGHIAVTIADTKMVGDLGKVAIASVTVAFSIFIPFMMLGIGISYGVSPLIAKADGENNKVEISSLLKHSFFLNIAIGLLIGLLLYLCAPLLWKLNQPPAVIELAIPFLEILAMNMIPLMLFQTFRQFAEGLAVTRQAMYISITGNLINIALNYLLIHGNYGFPKLGVSGAAYATLSARIFMAIAMFVFVFYSSRFIIYWKEIKNTVVSLSVFKKLLTMTLPVGIQLTLESAAFGFAALMIGWMGESPIAAHHVALTMAAVPYMAATGFASAATVRVGNYFGRKDYTELRKAGMAAFHIVIFFMTLCALCFILLRDQLPHFFITDPNVESIATSLLLICAFFQLSDGVQVVGLGALRGIGEVRTPTFIAMLAYWIIGIPSGYLFAFTFGMNAEGVWYGLFLGLMAASLMLFVRFNNKSKMLIAADKKVSVY